MSRPIGEPQLLGEIGAHDNSPEITTLNDGGYVVAWSHSSNLGGYHSAILVEQFDDGGNKISSSELIGVDPGEYKDHPRIAALADGGYAVTWSEYDADGHTDIFLQQFDSAGNRVADDRLFDTETLSDMAPHITALNDGGYVVSWHGITTDEQSADIFFQQFDSAGNRVADSRLHGMDGQNDYGEQTTALNDGGYVVAWRGYTTDENSGDIFVRQFDASGNQVAEDRLHGVEGSYNEDTELQIVTLSDGGYSMSWQGGNSDGQGYDIFVQRFDPQGNRTGDLTRLQGQNGDLDDTKVQIAALKDGGSAVVWQGETSDAEGTDIFVQHFDMAGQPTTSTRLQGVSGQDDASAQITALNDGGYVVSWVGGNRDTGGADIFVQEFDNLGNKVGDIVSLQGNPGVIDIRPQITAHGDSGYIVTWDGESSQGWDVFVQRFGPVCFTRGTLIATDGGEVPVETLSVGDQVWTQDHGLQTIRWIGAQELSASELLLNPNYRPVRIRAGALGERMPASDLLVSPQHRLLVSSPVANRMFGQREVLVAAIHLLEVSGIDIAEDVPQVEYWHFHLDRHEVVFSNGAATESLYAGPVALGSVSPEARTEILALFPELSGNGALPPIPARPLIRGAKARRMTERLIKNNRPVVALALKWECDAVKSAQVGITS